MTKPDQEAYQEFLNNQEQQFKDRFENDLNVFLGNVESIDPELSNQMRSIKRDGVKG